MQFNISLDKILHSRAKTKILKYLFSEEVSMSERELASIVKVSHMTINRLMKELKALNLVSLEKAGNVNLWRVNKKSYAYHTLFQIIKGLPEALRPIEHLQDTILRHLPKTAIQSAVLFGSIAAGHERPNSDIDLFLLVKNKKTKDKMKPYIDKLFNLCLDLYGNRLSPYVLTEAELVKKQNLPLLSKIKHGIQLYPSKEKGLDDKV